MNTAINEPAAKAPRFESVHDETVSDNSTGLIWTRDSVGDKRMTFDEAKAACADLDLGSDSDWRLPTIHELLTLVDYETHDPAIDTEAFNCKSSWYWTGTPAAPSPGDCEWIVHFYDGYAYWNDHNYSGFVRAVRGSQ